jgi:hypothetical protein
MKTNNLLLCCVTILFFTCSKNEIEQDLISNSENTPLYHEDDTVDIDEISYYYLDGEETELENIIETDEQVWATHLNGDGEAICDVFSDDAGFLTWWSNNGATQSELDRYTACMAIRDYAITHNITTQYPDEENFENLPQHFIDYVLSKIPGYYQSYNKNSGEKPLVHAYIELRDGTNMTGTSRSFTTLHSHYGSFRNDASSGVLVVGGATIFCDWIWYGGRKWAFVTLIGAQFNTLGTGDNRFDSHF